MDHQTMFKARSRVDASAQKKQLRTRQAAVRANRRQENQQAHRNISLSPGTPQPSTSSRTVPKRAFPTKGQEKIARLQQLRQQENEKRQVKSRSPFISVVPTGRIVPAKRDVVEEKMKKFHEKVHERATRSNLNRRSGSSQKGRSAVKTTNRAKPVIAKPVLRVEKNKTKEKKRESKEPQPEVEEAANQTVKPSNTGYFFFTESDGAVGGEPEPFTVPEVIQSKKTKPASPLFNQQFSFITSTTSKKNSAKKRIVEETDVEFFEGISPLEATKVEEMEPKEPEKEDNSPNLNETFETPSEEEKSPGLNDTFPTPVEDEKVAELNGTFSTEEDEDAKKDFFQTAVTGKIETPKSATVRRSQIKNGETVEVSLDLPVIEENARKSRSGSLSSTKPRKSQRLSDVDHPNSSVHVKRETADHHFSVLNSEITRLHIEIEKWAAQKSDELSEVANGMIDAAIGQTELLIRKKFSKFRELVELFESGDPRVLADDLEGYWCAVYIEVESLNRRYEELQQWQANDWVDPVEKSTRRQVKATRQKKNTAQPTAVLKSLIEKMRAKQNRVAPEDDTGAPVRSKRLQDTPTKRRSLNCSGCTPRKSAQKSAKKSILVSTLPEGSPHTSMRKSVKKIAFADENQPRSARMSTRKTVAIVDPTPAIPDSILKGETKSARKRATKSVLFAVSDTPENSGDVRPKKRNAKTPRPSKSILAAVENENIVEESPSSFPLPIDTSKVTLSRGRHSRRATPKPIIAVNSSGEQETQETPVLPVAESRRSKRLFSGLFN